MWKNKIKQWNMKIKQILKYEKKMKQIKIYKNRI